MILIAIGANLVGPAGTKPLETCRQASLALDGLANLRLAALSPWYETAPVPASDQPSYVNGVARMEGKADPQSLLESLQRLEQAYGRVRGDANAARTLDLDIIAMGEQVRTGSDPILPHPRMHMRAFVLMPLLDVAPDWRHPGSGIPAKVLLAGVSKLGVVPLAIGSHLP